MDSARASGPKDYYYILGVSHDATTVEIQEAFQELYNRVGPHVNLAGDESESVVKAYMEVSEAYAVLIDPKKRQEYDQVVAPHLQKAHLRELWGKLTGKETKPDSKNMPDDTVMDCEVTLREAIKGTTNKLRIDENMQCGSCLTLKPVQRMQCSTCRGVGHTHNTRFESIVMEPGLCDRMQIRKQNLGKYDIRTGRYSDLVVIVKLKPHQFFTVVGRDVTCTVPVTILEAVLGSEIEVPTPVGKVIMKIQPLTQSGRVYRLKGMGLAGADLLATMEVVVPKQISADEVELFRKLKTVSTSTNPREDILARLKETGEGATTAT